MISNLRPQHAPDLLSWVLKGRDKSDDMWQFWRGRYGLSETEQAGVWGSVGWAHGEEKRFEDQAKVQTQQIGEKVIMRFKTFDGDLKEVTATIAETLLAIGKREGLPAIEGVCGGKLGTSTRGHMSEGLICRMCNLSCLYPLFCTCRRSVRSGT
jgi:hypothetical protein